MADHCRSVHNSKVSDNLFEDYEFVTTNTYTKPLHRQVDEFLMINNAEQKGVIKINRKVTWKVNKELLNRQDENWSWGSKSKLTAGQKSWGSR